MYRLPEASTAIDDASEIWPLAAFPPSPENPHVSLPAMVVMIPVGELTLRTTALFWSRMYRFPELSTATAWGRYRLAAEAGPPSPDGYVPCTPPTTVVMMPVSAFTWRTVLL